MHKCDLERRKWQLSTLVIIIFTKGIFIEMFYVGTEVSKKTLKLSGALLQIKSCGLKFCGITFLGSYCCHQTGNLSVCPLDAKQLQIAQQVNLSCFNKYRESFVFFQEKIANMIRICNLGQDLGSLHSSLASLIPSTPRGGDSLWSLLQWRWCTTSSEEWRCRLSERGKGNKMFTAMLQWADPTRATDKSPRSTTVQCFVPQTHGIHPTMFHNCERSRGH